MAFHGKGGDVDFSGSLVRLNSWSLTTTVDTADSTSMLDSWESNVAGLSDYTATVEGDSEKSLATVSLLGTEASLSLELVADTTQFEANAILTGITETSSIEDIGKITYSFEGSDTTPIGSNLS